MTDLEVTVIDEQTEALQCGECGAPVAAEQRYCVICGAHRAKAADPVARYFGEASRALARVKASDSARAATLGRRTIPSVSARLTVLLVVVAALIGFGIGDSSSGGTTVTRTITAHSSTAVHGTTTARTKTSSSTGQNNNNENNLPNGVSEQ